MKRESRYLIGVGIQCLLIIILLYWANEREIAKWYHRHYSNDENRNYESIAATWFISFKDILGDANVTQDGNVYRETSTLIDNKQYMGFALGNGKSQDEVVKKANVLAARILEESKRAIYEKMKEILLSEEIDCDNDKVKSNNIRISTKAECVQSTWGTPYGGDKYMAVLLTPSFSFTIHYEWILSIDPSDRYDISNLKRDVRIDKRCSIAAVRYYGVKNAVRKWSQSTAINEGVGMANYDGDEYVNEYYRE